MSVSIGGIVFKISSDNTEYKKGMSEAVDVRKRVSDTIAKYDKQEASLADKINKAYDKRIEKEKELDRAVKEGSSQKVISGIRKELAKLTQQEEQAVAQSVALNEKRRNAYKKLTNEIKNASSIKGKFSSLSSLVGVASMATGAAAAIGAVTAVAKHYLDVADELGKRAADFNITADGLRYLQEQAGYAGVNASELDDGLKTLKKSFAEAVTGVTSKVEALEKLGVSLQNVDGTYKSFDEVIVSVADGFANYKGRVDEAKIAEDLLGGSGQKLIRIFAEGGEAIKDKLQVLGEYSQAAESAATLNDSIAKATNTLSKWGTAAAGIAADVFNVVTMGMQGESYLDHLSLERHKRFQKQEAEKKALIEAAIATQKAENLKQWKEEEAAAVKLDELDKKLTESRLNDLQKVGFYQQEINSLKAAMTNYDEYSVEYGKLYEKVINKQITLEATKKRIKQEQDKIEEQRVAKEKKAQEDAEKKAQAEAEKIKAKQDEQAKSYNEFLKEHELQKRIATAKYQGNEALADRIKQEAEAQKLAEKYNISIKEANKLLNEQKKIKEINDGKNGRYSDKEIEKAKKILAKGKTGTIGAKTLEDAQNIIDGKATKYNLSIFDSANQKNKSKKRDFNRERNLNRGFDSKPTPKQAEDKKDEQSKNISSMDETLKGIQSLLTDIKTLQQKAVIETANLSKAITE